MAGQIAPKNLFDLRPDLRALSLLLRLKEKNAHTIFGAVADELQKGGVTLIPALPWLKPLMPKEGFRLIVYLPQATVIHYEGQSSAQVVAARHIRFESSKIYYFRKHYGIIQAETLRLVILGTYILRLVEEWGKWLVGHKREMRRQRIRAYQQVLRSGLRPAPKR